MREIKYLHEAKNEFLQEIQQEGWNNDRLEVICELNAFYQVIIGPLASSARERTGVLGEEIPILYGELLRFDAKRSRRIRSLHQAFMDATSDLPAHIELLTANHAYDMITSLRMALKWR
jgi:hypothetical protein